LTRIGLGWIAVVAACAALLPGDPAAGAPAADKPPVSSVAIQLLDAPVSLRHDPRALTYIVDHLNPGAVIRRRIEVINRSSTTQRIDVYPAAADIADARFQFADNRTANELTSWISPSVNTVNLKPYSSAVVAVTIRIPAQASSGERYAVIWASTTSPKGSAQVTVIQRVGIRVYLDVGPGGAPRSDFAIVDCTAARTSTGQPLLTVTVTNTGHRALDMIGQVALSEGPAGMRAGPFPVTKGVTLAIGETGTVSVPLPAQLPTGPWDITVTLSSGLISHTADSTITFPPDGTSKVTALHNAGGNTPTILLSIAAGLASIGGFALLIRRIYRRAG
jgi:hypothetical protein